MFRYINFFLVGLIFGIVIVKSEIVSWYRIFEMFQFQSIHMYGIITSAIVIGMLGLYLFRKFKVKDIHGEPIVVPDKLHRYKSGFIGGSIFGLGWALAGACPGPMYVLFGTGVFTIAIVLFGAFLGTVVYGILRPKLPH
jgi:uncharacterized membrane protein YedE/YeeE